MKDNESNLTGDDVREGLTAVISVKLKDPQFSSQTKEKLVSPEAASAVATVFSDAFSAWLDENPTEARRIIEKAISAARTRLAVQKVRETARKSAMEGFSLPGSSPIVQTPIRPAVNSTLLRVIAQAARRNRDVTGAFRRFCRCAGRFLMSKRVGLIACSRMPRCVR